MKKERSYTDNISIVRNYRYNNDRDFNNMRRSELKIIFNDLVKSQIGTDTHLLQVAVMSNNLKDFFELLMSGVNPYKRYLYILPNSENKYNDVLSTAAYYQNRTVTEFMDYFNAVIKFDDSILNNETSSPVDFDEYYKTNFVDNGFIKNNLPVAIYIFAISKLVKDTKEFNEVLKIAYDCGYSKQMIKNFVYDEYEPRDNYGFGISGAEDTISIIAKELKS